MQTVDLTAPSADPGIRLIIEKTTDPAVRQRVATDPTVVAIAATAVGLPAERRQRISARYIDNFNIYRPVLSRIRHRIRKAAGPTELTMRALIERLHKLLDCPGGGACHPYHTCDTGFFTSAVTDAIYAHLAGQWLNDGEHRLFNGPWRSEVTAEEEADSHG
jgi:hypothetical protein